MSRFGRYHILVGLGLLGLAGLAGCYPSPTTGQAGQACNPHDVCLPGLSCVAGVCQAERPDLGGAVDGALDETDGGGNVDGGSPDGAREELGHGEGEGEGAFPDAGHDSEAGEDPDGLPDTGPDTDPDTGPLEGEGEGGAADLGPVAGDDGGPRPDTGRDAGAGEGEGEGEGEGAPVCPAPGGPCQGEETSPCPAGIELGECRPGSRSCVAGCWGPCLGRIDPVPELCDDRDNDCDGLTDEEFGLGVDCQAPGECGAGQVECDDWDPLLWQVRCSSGPGGSAARATDEVCDGRDNDCDEAVDEELGTLACGLGRCRRVVPACPAGQPGVCQPGDPGVEVCNGEDDDCDDEVDEELGSCALARTPWPMARHDPARTGQSPDHLGPRWPGVVWQVELGAEVRSSPIVGEDAVFVVTDQGLHRIDLAHPEAELLTPLADPVDRTNLRAATPVLLADGRLLVESGTTVLQVAIREGAPVGQTLLECPADQWGGPVIPGSLNVGAGTIYVLRLCGGYPQLFASPLGRDLQFTYQRSAGCFANNNSNGRGLLPTALRGATLAASTDNELKFVADPGGAAQPLGWYGTLTTSAPLLAGADDAPDAYLALTDPEPALVRRGTVRPDRRWPLPGLAYGSPALAPGGAILIGSQAGTLHQVTGELELVWEQALLGPVQTGPVVDRDGGVYVATGRGVVHAFTQDGRERWRFHAGSPIGTEPVLAGEELLLVGTLDGRLLALGSAGEQPPDDDDDQVAADQDCDDQDPQVQPGLPEPESCDLVDQDCDGQAYDPQRCLAQTVLPWPAAGGVQAGVRASALPGPATGHPLWQQQLPRPPARRPVVGPDGELVLVLDGPPELFILPRQNPRAPRRHRLPALPGQPVVRGDGSLLLVAGGLLYTLPTLAALALPPGTRLSARETLALALVQVGPAGAWYGLDGAELWSGGPGGLEWTHLTGEPLISADGQRFTDGRFVTATGRWGWTGSCNSPQFWPDAGALLCVSGSILSSLAQEGGAQRWSQSTGQTQQEVTTLAATGEQVRLVGEQGRLIALDPAGAPRWEQTVRHATALALDSAGNSYVLAQGRLCSYDAEGVRRWCTGGAGNPDALPAGELVLGGPDVLYLVGDAEPRTVWAFGAAAAEDWDGDALSPAAGDCNDGDAATEPGQPEICDLFDQDCDGEIDDGCEPRRLGGSHPTRRANPQRNGQSAVAGPEQAELRWALPLAGFEWYDGTELEVIVGPEGRIYGATEAYVDPPHYPPSYLRALWTVAADGQQTARLGWKGIPATLADGTLLAASVTIINNFERYDYRLEAREPDPAASWRKLLPAAGWLVTDQGNLLLQTGAGLALTRPNLHTIWRWAGLGHNEELAIPYTADPQGHLYVWYNHLYALDPTAPEPLLGTLQGARPSGALAWSPGGGTPTLCWTEGAQLRQAAADSLWPGPTLTTPDGARLDPYPAVAPDGTIFVSSDNGTLYRIAPRARPQLEPYFQLAGQGRLHAPLLDPEGRLYVGSEEGDALTTGKLYGLDQAAAAPAQPRWEVELGHPVASPVSLGPDRTLYVITRDGYLIAVGPPPEP